VRRKDDQTRSNEPPRRWLRGLLRAGLVLTFVGVVAGGGVYHSARAQMDETFFGLGEHMMLYEYAAHQDAPRDLVINGQTIKLSSGTTTRSMGEVLDFFEARCADSDGEIALQMAQLAADHPEVTDEVAPSDLPTLREQGARTGYVACFDMGDASIEVTEVLRRIRAYNRTGDVAEIGDMRYVFAERTEQGAHFVALWTEGEFNVRRMFPAEGDAPGLDVEGVTRPPRSRRMLTGFERGQPHSMTVYHSRLDEAGLESFYRRELVEHGWTLMARPEDLPTDTPPTLIAERDDRMVTLVFLPNEQEGGASAAVFDAR